MKTLNISRSPMAAKQSGFTLVEIAIVLVIIGLLLGGVLKGQELIQNAKVKNLVNDMKGISAAYYTYIDRYKAMPGDDPAAATRFTGAVNGGGNGIIAGNYNAVAAPAVAAESNNFWQHTRMAGLLSGTATAAAALPGTNAMGGFLGVEDAAYGITGTVVCAGSIPWGIAQSIDIQLDDGESATGNVRTSLAGAANLVTTAVANNVYGLTAPAVNTTIQDGMHTVCMKM